MAKTPLSASRIWRSGRSRVQPTASCRQFLMAKFSRLELPVTPSRQRERALSNSEKSEGLRLSPRHLRTSNLESLTPTIPANSNRQNAKSKCPVNHSKQRKRTVSNRQKIETLQFAPPRQCFLTPNPEPLISSSPSTFDGFVFSSNSTILGTLQAEPVSNVLGTRPEREERSPSVPRRGASG